MDELCGCSLTPPILVNPCVTDWRGRQRSGKSFVRAGSELGKAAGSCSGALAECAAAHSILCLCTRPAPWQKEKLLFPIAFYVLLC